MPMVHGSHSHWKRPERTPYARAGNRDPFSEMWRSEQALRLPLGAWEAADAMTDDQLGRVVSLMVDTYPTCYRGDAGCRCGHSGCASRRL